MTVYLIQSETGDFLDRHLEWVKSANPAGLFQTPHRDVALNQLVELNARDISLRARVVGCEADEQGQPDLTSVAA